MSSQDPNPSPAPSHFSNARPEFTLSSVLVGLLVAAFVGATYPYTTLKLGYGPNISVVSAFFGYITLGLIGGLLGRRGNRYEFNIVQTAGTAASQSAFMVIVLAGLDLLASSHVVTIRLSTMQIFVWLSLAGCLGVLLAVPLRRHYIDEENLTFADGTAAGETLLVLDQDGSTARRGVFVLTLGGVVSALVTWLRDAMPRLPEGAGFLRKISIPESTPFGTWGEKLHIGINWSLLPIASGMLIGLRVTVSMAFGMLLAWFLAPPLLMQHHWIVAETFRDNLKWVMWPAVGLMVSSGLTALALKWHLIMRTFRDLRGSSLSGTDFPLRWVGLGSAVLAVALVTMQKVSLGTPVWLSVIAILISVPLMIVGTRVLGETNWAPISSFGNLVQVVFAGLAPGSAGVNMITSGMSGTIAANGEHLMQDFKAGKIIGSNNRYLTYMQLLAVPVGSLAVALVYPLLRSKYGIGPDSYGLDPALIHQTTQSLSAPASVRWAGFAEVLSKGLGALPPHALQAFAISIFLGIVLTVLEPRSKWIPSATSVGLGMLIEPQYVMLLLVGGVIQNVWKRLGPASEAELNMPLASGLIVGEALLALVVTMLLGLGVFH